MLSRSAGRLASLALSKKGPFASIGFAQSMNMATYDFEHLAVTRPAEFVVQVELNRPEKRNALNPTLVREIGECFQQLAEDEDCRSVILAGKGKTWCAGLDFSSMAGLAGAAQDPEKDTSRKGFALRKVIQGFQNSVTSIEKCPKPVIAAVQSGCLGGGLAYATACDVRYCTADATFTIKRWPQVICFQEIDIGLAADVGALQRMPKSVGNSSLLRELAFTGRDFGAEEAMRLGVVSRVFDSKAEMESAVLALASELASKSPVALLGTKIHLNYSRDHSVDESLDYIVNWNATHLQGEDIVKAAMAAAAREKKPPTFSKL